MNLLERCQAGDAGAWETLFRARSAQIFRWAVLLGLRPAEAEDAAQEVFAIASRRIDSCQSEGAIGSWLYQITRRVVANMRRTGWWKRVLLSEEAPFSAFEEKEHPDTARELAIRACLNRLPRAQAEVLVLMDVEGFTREEVADMLGLPPGTVASRLRLGRRAFREHWEAMGETPDTAALSWGQR